MQKDDGGWFKCVGVQEGLIKDEIIYEQPISYSMYFVGGFLKCAYDYFGSLYKAIAVYIQKEV